VCALAEMSAAAFMSATSAGLFLPRSWCTSPASGRSLLDGSLPSDASVSACEPYGRREEKKDRLDFEGGRSR
jgi:hypothetical protein